MEGRSTWVSNPVGGSREGRYSRGGIGVGGEYIGGTFHWGGINYNREGERYYVYGLWG